MANRYTVYQPTRVTKKNSYGQLQFYWEKYSLLYMKNSENVLIFCIIDVKYSVTFKITIDKI